MPWSRIAARIAQRRIAALLGDPKKLLSEFEAALHKLSGVVDSHKVEEIRRILTQNGGGDLSSSDPTLRETTKAAYRAYLYVKDMPLHDPGHALFLSILQSYVLPPALRKQVEMAVREYMKARAPSLPKKQGYLAALDIYEKTLALARKNLKVAQDAISQGAEHSAGGAGATKTQVGPFTLINAGGFPENVVAQASELIAKAADMVRRAGFGKVLYGDVHLTNTIRSKSNILAFYLDSSDEMFVRANSGTVGAALETTIHELGHRFANKFLRGGERAEERLYRAIKYHEEDQAPSYSDRPKPGEKIVDKGTTYEAVTTEPKPGGGYRVMLRFEGMPAHAKVSIPLEAWLARTRKTVRDPQAPDFRGFATNYARKNPAENFAEMFMLYCMDKLPASQKDLFEETVRGS